MALGDLFGHVDLANDKDFFKNWMNKKKQRRHAKVTMQRIFTVQALETCDLLTLTLEDLDKMNIEFPSISAELIEDAQRKLSL